MKKILLVALAAAGLAGSAFAQAPLGSLLVGFRDTAAASSLTVNIGTEALLAGGPVVDVGNYASVLSSTFGSGWATDTGLLWSAAGTTGSAPGTRDNFIGAATSGSPLDGVTATATPWNTPVASGGSSAASKITAVLGGASSTVGGTTVLQNTVAQAWANSVNENGAAAWGQFNKIAYEQAGAGQVDVFNLNSTTSAGQPGTFIGTFNLQSNGELFFFGTSAIPEPSTYAALLGVVTLGIVAIRRRRQASIEV
jgi:hypothetical protein